MPRAAHGWGSPGVSLLVEMIARLIWQPSADGLAGDMLVSSIGYRVERIGNGRRSLRSGVASSDDDAGSLACSISGKGRG
jgi:hypothetical protein